MKAHFSSCVLIIFLFSFLFSNGLFAQAKAYKDGSVWSLTMVKTKTGMGDDYLKSLKSTLKVIEDEAVKQGLLLSYKILQGSSANEDDWDMLLMEEYKNMASLDGLDDKMKVIRDKFLGGDPGEKKLMQDRVEMRHIYGDKLMREVIF